MNAISRQSSHSLPLRVAVLTAHEGSSSWRGLLRKLEESGQVTIRQIGGYSDEEYRRSVSGYERTRLRIKTYLLYPFSIVLRSWTLSRNFDVVVVITAPFFLPVLASVFVRGPRLVVLQNDIYPEALIVRRIISRGGLLDRLLRSTIAAALRRCAAVVYIAEEHRELVANVLGSHAGDVVIPVPSSLQPLPTHQRGKRQNARVTVLYSGTLGSMHDTSTFVRYMAERSPPVTLVFQFRTSGAGKAAFESIVASQLAKHVDRGSIELGDSLADADWAARMLSTEVGLVFQRAGAGDVIFPSKAASILVAGQALIAIANRSSSLGRLVEEFDCGWIVEPGDVDGLEGALREAVVPSILETKRENAGRIGRERFALDAVASQWLRVITAGSPLE